MVAIILRLRLPHTAARTALPFLLAGFISVVMPPVRGFAYAPNFITKIIEKSTGVAPVGLLDVGGRSNDDDDNSAAAECTAEISGPITTRFPPEPNGYLHLGHAKAVSFNFAVARAFSAGNGRCHMRLDDTNPSTEDEEYVQSILEDVRWVQRGMEPFVDEDVEGGEEKRQDDAGPWFGKVRKTSDYFQLIYDAAVHLIKSGEAFVDELTAEEMREYRGTLTEPGRESPFRHRSMEENLELFEGMCVGEFPDGRYVLRAKIDMASPNLNLRDPVLYRIKHETHQATGGKWCIYPMYDFSHPIADAVEGITHSLCTLEFEDHRPLYDWVADRVLRAGLVGCLPRQIEFSRLNLKYTVLSKRKLITLVKDAHVAGWDDPRMPTLSGIRRRGFPPRAIRLFCERVGISKSDSNIDFGVLEDCVREVLDANSPRAFAILDPLKVTITNWAGSSLEDFEVPCHPKREELGGRTVSFGGSVYIERSDFFDLDGPEGQANDNRPPPGFKRLLLGGRVRLKYAYVISCDEVVRDATTNEPEELLCTVYPETRGGVTPEGQVRVKGIIQWVEASSGALCQVMQYDRLFKAEEPGNENDNFTDDINKESLKVIENVMVEPSVARDALRVIGQFRNSASALPGNHSLYHSDLTYQFERSGYFALDTSSTLNNLVFNRVVTLRDAWAGNKMAEQPKIQKQKQQPKKGSGEKKDDVGGRKASIQDARRVALRAGTIVEAGPHPEADSLILCKLDCGDVTEAGDPEEPRTVVAGLAGKLPFEDLIGRKIVCITNLKRARMRGVESAAMLLVASDGKGDSEMVQLLDVPSSVPNGELLSFEGMAPSEPDAMLKSKGALKVWDRVRSKLRVNKNGEASYRDEDDTVRRIMTSAGPVKISSLTDCMIG